MIYTENKKNYDPAMHSAEHILNQTMVRMFNTGRAFSAHLEKKKSKCDYKITELPGDDQIKAVEDKVNQVIRMNLDITEEFTTREEAEGRFNLSRLPEDGGETVRIIKVGDYDACPCSGPHVKNTSEIGAFRIISYDFNDGVLRLRFRLDR